MTFAIWTLHYLTWCAFLFVCFSVSDFRKLANKARTLEQTLKEKEEALEEAENYINGQKHTMNKVIY